MKKISFALALAAAANAAALDNGCIWKDTDGVHINAHGGGLLKDGETWYWYGEHKIAGKAGNRAQTGVGCYSSRDLLAWKNEGIALAVSDEAGHDIEKDCILERPKVVKAPATGKYVMLFHLERKGLGYKDARTGFAAADSPAGPFKFVRSCRPVDGKMMSRDMTLFTDDDGSVWHVFASEENSTLHFAELAKDCLGYTGRWHTAAEKHWTEAPALIKRGGWYWLLGSGCTGWKPNAARIYRAKSLAGPWEWMGNPCTGVNPANMLGPDKTWGGQSTFIFHDEKTGRDVACFDIWNPANAIDGRYAWLPVTWHGDGLPEIPWRGEWSREGDDGLTLRGGPNSVWGVYQWGVEVDGTAHKETKKPARAYLWIPPETKTVKAVVVGNDNMLEEPLFSNADFRRTLAAADIAIVFVTPGLLGFHEKFGEGDVPALDALLAKLAKASGHPELAKDAKIVPLGHSAWADWPYLCTAAMPGRVKCAVSLKGSWPHFKPQFDDAFWKKTEGVPMLLVSGEYEWFSEHIEKVKGFLGSHPGVKLHSAADRESGHFDMSDALPLAIAKFIVDGTMPSIPGFGGKFTALGFEDRDGGIVAQNPRYHLQVTVPFQPAGEGFKAKADFDKTVPPGRPERWAGKKAGEPNDKPEMPREAIDVKVIQGPAVKTGLDTFDIRFNRHGFDGYRAREVVLAAVYPGDAHWKRSVQQAILRFPVNTHGAENAIEWNPPGKAVRGDFPLALDAKASSGLPVRYFVREGPAVVGDDGVLRLRDWPLGAKSCDITVCAYQWGADGGKVKTAEPVWRTLTVDAGVRRSAGNVVKVDAGKALFETAPDLWGIFFEDIDLSLDGGVYAEMVRNRSFEDCNGRHNQLTLQYWHPVGGAEYFLDSSEPLSPQNRHSCCFRGKAGAGIANDGYFGMGVEKGKAYKLSVALRGATPGPVEVSLEAYSKPPLAKAEISGVAGDWKTFEATLVANDTDPEARLVLRMKEGGELFADCVSLFPGDAVAGLFRRDLVERLAALRPSFLRFPGGCWVEGATMKDAYRWKTTIGDKWNRRTQWNVWQYWATNGVGFHEYLVLCEALGAKPLFCINCGMSHKDNVPMDKMDEFVQDALDCIEYANGPVDSVWGAKRAAAGHPEPFGLEYLEIGNENGGKAYEERYALIAKAVRERYPEVKLVFDNWKETKRVADPKDLRDDHFYDSPDRFMGALAREYDEKKGDFDIFVGEYAVTKCTHRYGSLRGAIGEAAFMLGLERNQNQVKLAAYAPLFANAQHTVWTPNMIYPMTLGSFVSPSWNVQKLFSENRGREVLKVEVETGTYESDTNFAWGRGVNHNVIENIQAGAVRDADGSVILKIVNCTGEPQEVKIEGVSGKCVKTVFGDGEAMAHNSPAEPEALKETVSEFELHGGDTLPPLSLTIYRCRPGR